MGNVTRHDIVEAIRSLGVRPGDELLAHASLSSFGRVDGGADAVAGALIESVSPGGTVIVPTFNYGTLPYDPATTPSLTGAVTDAFWRLPGAVRSAHPTHSFAGVGPLAEELMRDHGNDQTLGRGSPLWKLWERDAWVLLIGCDHTANSMIHVAEERMNVTYLNRTRLGQRVRRTEVIDVTVRRPGCSHGFNVVDQPLRRADAVREAIVGRAQLALMRAKVIVRAAGDLLERDATALLCDQPSCERCTWARQRISEPSRSA